MGVSAALNGDKPAKGLEPLTIRLQSDCAADCATPADRHYYTIAGGARVEVAGWMHMSVLAPEPP